VVAGSAPGRVAPRQSNRPLRRRAVSTGDAIIFPGGANLGAAAYEYGLAGLTSAVLHRKYASFEDDWVPQQYLADYYRAVEPDERETIAFFVETVAQQVKPDRPVLYFGVGPTLHHVFLAAGTASEIHLGDYLPANLAEVQRWLDNDEHAHDWSPFVRYTLQCEGLPSPTEAEIARREDLTRIDQADLRTALQGPTGAVEVRTLSEQEPHGYSGIVLGRARRSEHG
jgi:hypothetical protein